MRPSRRAIAASSSVLHVPPRVRPGATCGHCWRHLASAPVYIVCAHGACNSLAICLDCFYVGAADGYPHQPDHPYRVVEQVKTQLFEQDWSADDELRLINALCEYGPYHWREISERVGKTQEKCERHYERVYLTGENAPLPTTFLPPIHTPPPVPTPQPSPIPVPSASHAGSFQQLCPSSLDSVAVPPVASAPPPVVDCSIHLPQPANFPAPAALSVQPSDDDDPEHLPTGNVMPNPSYGNDTNIEGYMPRRADLDVEYDDNAEEIIADIAIGENDTEEENDLKLRLLQMYDKRLTRRDEMKQFMFERDLIHVDKLKVGDRRHTRDEKELLARLQVFSRLLPNKEFRSFRDAIMREFRLSREIHRLQQCRAEGVKRRAEVDVYELERKARATRVAKGSTMLPTPVRSNTTASPLQQHKRRPSALSTPCYEDVTPSSAIAATSISPAAVPFFTSPSAEFPPPLPNHPSIDAFSTTGTTGLRAEVNECGSAIVTAEDRVFPREAGSTSPLINARIVHANSLLHEDVNGSFVKNDDLAQHHNPRDESLTNSKLDVKHNVPSVGNCGKTSRTFRPGMMGYQLFMANDEAKGFASNNDGLLFSPAPLLESNKANNVALVQSMPLRSEIANAEYPDGETANGENDGDAPRKFHEAEYPMFLSNKGRESKPSSTVLRQERRSKRLSRSPYPQLQPMPIHNLPDVWKLTATEQNICSALHMNPTDFLCQRDAMLNQAFQQLHGKSDQHVDNKGSILTLRCANFLPTSSYGAIVSDGSEAKISFPSAGPLTASLQVGDNRLITEKIKTEAEKSETLNRNIRNPAQEQISSHYKEDERQRSTYDNELQACNSIEEYRPVVSEFNMPNKRDATSDTKQGFAGLRSPVMSDFAPVQLPKRVSVLVDATGVSDEAVITPTNPVSSQCEVRTHASPRYEASSRQHMGTQCPRDLEIGSLGEESLDDGPCKIVSPDMISGENRSYVQTPNEMVSRHPAGHSLFVSDDEGPYGTEHGSNGSVGRFCAELGAKLGANAKIMIEVDTSGGWAGLSGASSADLAGEKLRELGGGARVADNDEPLPSDRPVMRVVDKRDEANIDERIANENAVEAESGVPCHMNDMLSVISQWRPLPLSAPASTGRKTFLNVGETVNIGLTQVSQMDTIRVSLAEGESGNLCLMPLYHTNVKVKVLDVTKADPQEGSDVLPSKHEAKDMPGSESVNRREVRKRPRGEKVECVESASKQRRRTKRILLSEDEEEEKAALGSKVFVEEDVLEEGDAGDELGLVQAEALPAVRRGRQLRSRGHGIEGSRKEPEASEPPAETTGVNSDGFCLDGTDGILTVDPGEKPEGNEMPKVLLRLRLSKPESTGARQRRDRALARASLSSSDVQSNRKRNRRASAFKASLNEGVGFSSQLASPLHEEEMVSKETCYARGGECSTANIEKADHVDERARFADPKSDSAPVRPEVELEEESTEGHGKVCDKHELENEKTILVAPLDSAPSNARAMISQNAEEVDEEVLDEGREFADPATEQEPQCHLKGDGEDSALEIVRPQQSPSTARRERCATRSGQKRRRSDCAEDVKGVGSGSRNEDEERGKKRICKERDGQDCDGEYGRAIPERDSMREDVVWIEPATASSTPGRLVTRAGGRGSGRRGRKPASSSVGRGGRGRGSNATRRSGATAPRMRVATRSSGERYSLRRKT